MPPLLRPAAPSRAPTVGVVAPASSAMAERLAAGERRLLERGWRVRWMSGARGRSSPYLSGTPAQRLEDLHAAFADPEIDLIVCTRGGYGSNYLLDGLDLDLIAQKPKPLFGYSDLTAVQTTLLDRIGLVSFHAPMLAADFYREDGVDEPSLRSVLAGDSATYGLGDGLRVLRPGVAEGPLRGGCLSLLTAALGTPWAPRTESSLLFLEDVAAKPYQIDRMLRHLQQAGKLEGVTGIVFGEMLECDGPADRPQLLEEAILHALGDFAGPVAIGLRSGHVSRANVTLPLGPRARLVAGDGSATLALLEAGVDVRS